MLAALLATPLASAEARTRGYRVRPVRVRYLRAHGQRITRGRGRGKGIRRGRAHRGGSRLRSRRGRGSMRGALRRLLPRTRLGVQYRRLVRLVKRRARRARRSGRHLMSTATMQGLGDALGAGEPRRSSSGGDNLAHGGAFGFSVRGGSGGGARYGYAAEFAGGDVGGAPAQSNVRKRRRRRRRPQQRRIEQRQLRPQAQSEPRVQTSTAEVLGGTSYSTATVY
ncbi:MAG: hypothetical protein KC503_06310 [Myxococcales bacterium]|nr:hypothetical protein [Myxococcales bacterium]